MMPFSEKIRLKVRKKSAFRCCRCHEIGIDVHHIIPESEGGPNDIDNAGPLCQNCHDRLGANPEKRKEIIQMRDWWYEVVKEKYTGESEKIKEINDLIIAIQKQQAVHSQQLEDKLEDMRNELIRKLDELKGSSEEVVVTNSEKMQTKVGQFITATTLANRVHANFLCKKCGTKIGLLIGSNRCPNCREPIG